MTVLRDGAIVRGCIGKANCGNAAGQWCKAEECKGRDSMGLGCDTAHCFCESIESRRRP